MWWIEPVEILLWLGLICFFLWMAIVDFLDD